MIQSWKNTIQRNYHTHSAGQDELPTQSLLHSSGTVSPSPSEDDIRAHTPPSPHLSEGRCSSTDVCVTKLLLSCQDQWRQLLWGLNTPHESSSWHSHAHYSRTIRTGHLPLEPHLEGGPCRRHVGPPAPSQHRLLRRDLLPPTNDWQRFWSSIPRKCKQSQRYKCQQAWHLHSQL